jgi:predicted site-specific integrase-resolvase
MSIAVRRHEAANLLGISERQLDTWIAEGKVHKPYKVSPRIVLFDVDRLRADWARIRDETSKEESNEWDEVLQ